MLRRLVSSFNVLKIRVSVFDAHYQGDNVIHTLFVRYITNMPDRVSRCCLCPITNRRRHAEKGMEAQKHIPFMQNNAITTSINNLPTFKRSERNRLQLS